jgi:2-dehydropantoate 2-reductase
MSTRTRVALIGPGAIGGTLAAWLGENAKLDVTICARTPFAQLVVDVPGDRTLRSTPRVLVDPAKAEPVDWILSVTKTSDTTRASRWMKPLSSAETKLAVIQNGVEHVERLAPIFPRECILPVIVDIPAERSAPGRIMQRRHGDIHAPAGSLGESFRALFEGTELTPTLTEDFLTASWRKLALNSAGIVHALTLKPAKVVQNEGAARAMRAICEEAIAVGRAEGAKLGDTVADELVERLWRSPPESVSSFLADRLAKRPMEIDARHGVVVRLGRKHGIPTPLTEMAIALLEAAIE